MLLTTYNLNKELRLYRLGIVFDPPRIRLQHLKTISYCCPLDFEQETITVMHGPSPFSSHISYLDIVPAGPETENGILTQPFILAAFTVADQLQVNGGNHDTLCRWELQIGKSKLHTSFSTLSSKKIHAPLCVDLPVSITLIT